MPNMKIELLVSTVIGTGSKEKFVFGGDIISVDEKIAKTMIDDNIAIDPKKQAVKVLKDDELILENENLIEELKTLKEENELMILEIEKLRDESKCFKEENISLNLDLSNSKKV